MRPGAVGAMSWGVPIVGCLDVGHPIMGRGAEVPMAWEHVSLWDLVGKSPCHGAFERIEGGPAGLRPPPPYPTHLTKTPQNV